MHVILSSSRRLRVEGRTVKAFDPARAPPDHAADGCAGGIFDGGQGVRGPGRLPAARPGAAPPFRRRPGAPPPTPLVYASPHSGRHYPAEMLIAAAVEPEALRRSEDAFVDQLIAPAAAAGAALILARYGRAFMDLNRDPWELDPTMFSDELPVFAQGRTARVAAGLGAIARTAGEGREIYARKLTFAEAQARVAKAHAPYHDALDRLLARARNAHGMAVLIDWHSMPEAAAKTAVTPRHGKGCDIVLGDRFGAACTRKLTDLVERELEGMGYRVARNAPYAGGYTTEHY